MRESDLLLGDSQEWRAPQVRRLVRCSRAFSSRDPANFIADGHFSEQANGLIAQALLDVVRQQPHWATLSVPSTSVNGRE